MVLPYKIRGLWKGKRVSYSKLVINDIYVNLVKTQEAQHD
jgi:hypothetical protein